MSRVVGMKDVARLAGVSLGTVSNVVNRPQTVSSSTRLRVESAIASLGYVRSELARQLRAGNSRVMALLVLDVGNPFFVDLAKGAEEVAQEHGLVMLLSTSAEDEETEKRYLAHFAQQQVLGLLLSSASGADASSTSLRNSSIPVVLVDCADTAGDRCSVAVDDEVGGALAMQHLIDAGYEAVVFVGGPSPLPQVRRRFAGARRAATQAGLPPDALSVLKTDHLDIASGRDAGARLLGLHPMPNAAFCANDLLALGLLQALLSLGVRVPEDVALVGYDDIEFVGAASIPITSVRRPARLIGRTAAELLITEAAEAPEMHQHQRIVYQPELVVRASTLLT